MRTALYKREHMHAQLTQTKTIGIGLSGESRGQGRRRGRVVRYTTRASPPLNRDTSDIEGVHSRNL